MYYKIMKDDIVLDVIDDLRYVKYQKKHHIFLVCAPEQAQGVYSSDRKRVWRLAGLNPIPVEGYDIVDLVEIGATEYEQRKKFNGQTSNELIDAYTTLLVQGDKYQLIDSLSRCFNGGLLSYDEIKNLQKNNIITEEEFLSVVE